MGLKLDIPLRKGKGQPHVFGMVAKGCSEHNHASDGGLVFQACTEYITCFTGVFVGAYFILIVFTSRFRCRMPNSYEPHMERTIPPRGEYSLGEGLFSLQLLIVHIYERASVVQNSRLSDGMSNSLSQTSCWIIDYCVF